VRSLEQLQAETAISLGSVRGWAGWRVEEHHWLTGQSLGQENVSQTYSLGLPAKLVTCSGKSARKRHFPVYLGQYPVPHYLSAVTLPRLSPAAEELSVFGTSWMAEKLGVGVNVNCF
jgi:hypothetical protein